MTGPELVLAPPHPIMSQLKSDNIEYQPAPPFVRIHPLVVFTHENGVKQRRKQIVPKAVGFAKVLDRL